MPWNLVGYESERYREDFDAVCTLCEERDVAVQMIKSVSRRWRTRALEPFHTLSGGELAGYSAASCRVPPSHAVTTSSATAPGGSALMPTSVQVG